jgi:hypothetical protein
VLDPADGAGLLSGELISVLDEAQLLLPLFDGVDELPGLTEYGDVRRIALERMVARGGGFCVLASRPGFGAEALVPRTNQFELSGFGPTELESFVQCRLALGEAHEATELLEHVPPTLKAALSKPLFAAAWCERAETDPATAPRTVRDMMAELYLQCFDHRRRPASMGVADSLALRQPLGGVLACFAEAGFSTLSIDALRDTLTSTSVPDGFDLHRTLTVGVSIGLLREIGRSGFAAHPTPLAEYLIGWHFVSLALGDDRDRKRCVALFQRWIWIPELTGALEQAFGLMGNGSPLVPLCQAFIRWLADASGAEPRSAVGEIRDDLARPFGVLSLRLAAAAGLTERLPARTANHLMVSIEDAMQRVCGLRGTDRLVDAPRLGSMLPDFVPGELIDQLLTSLEGQPERGEHPTGDFVNATILLTERIRPLDAARYAQIWALRGGAEEYCWPWTLAAPLAAARIPESDSVSVFAQWRRELLPRISARMGRAIMAEAAARFPTDNTTRAIDELLSSSEDLERFGWAALQSCAMRVPTGDAMSVVKRLFESIGKVGAEVPATLWEVLIPLVATRFDHDSAAAFLREGCDVLESLLTPPLRRVWLVTMIQAAEALPHSAANTFVEQFIARIHPHSVYESGRLQDLAKVAGNRAHSVEASELSLRWLQRGLQAGEHETRRFWMAACLGAAESSDGRERSGLVSALVGRLAESSGAEAESILWILEAVTRRVSSSLAAALLGSVLRCPFRPTSDVARSLWSTVKWQLAGCLPHDEARRLVTDLFDRPASDDEVEDMGTAAIGGLVPTECVRFLVERALPSPTEVARPSRTIRPLLNRLEGAGDVDLYRALVHAGLRREAIQSAASSATVAIVGDPVFWERKPLDVRLRRDPRLTLDPECHLAPTTIRTFAGVPTDPAGFAKIDNVSASSTNRSESRSMASARAIAAQLRHGERRALLLIADQADRDQVPPTNVDVAAKLNVSDETGRRFCLRLQNLQLIARLGTGRQGYRPTDLGRAVLQAIKNDLTKKD